jgi:hypothetical protein
MSSIRDVVSPTDPVARFVLSVSMARNDVEHCTRSAVEANEADRPEFSWWVRVANGFTFEGIVAVRAWRKESEEVRQFINALPRHAQQQLAKAVSVEQDIGGVAPSSTSASGRSTIRILSRLTTRTPIRSSSSCWR